MALSGLSVICSLLALSWTVTQAKNVSQACKSQCQQIVTDRFKEDPACNVSCTVQQCSIGCDLWQFGIQSTCLDSCEQSNPRQFQVQRCLIGCNIAVDTYIEDVRSSMNNIQPPVLVAGTKTNVSVILQWTGAKILRNITYMLQRNYISGTYVSGSTEWQYHEAVHWIADDKLSVERLHPYATYRFRIVVAVTATYTVVSAESLPIATQPYGAPTTAPVITSATTSATSVHLKWRSPLFINAPLLYYKVIVAPANDLYNQRVREVIATRSTAVMSEVVTLLKPQTLYVVYLTAVNLFGEGPVTEEMIQTQRKSEADGETPYLVLGAESTVLKQDLNDVFAQSQILYRDDSPGNTVTGVAVHVKKRLVFASFADSSVRVLNADKKGSSKVICGSLKRPTALSVDWLHNHIYICDESQIVQCHLDGSRCNTVVSDLDPKPDAILVDPCNGYLFWVQQGQGVHRIDLADFKLPRERAIQRVLTLDLVSSIAIDYLRYRMFFPNESSNTMMSSALDGTDIVDIRHNTQNPDFITVKSLAYHQGLFYWSSGEKVVMEEYDASQSLYHHNDMFFTERSFTALNVWHPAAQPTPIPIMTPRKLQVLFTSDTAQVTWLPPDYDQGRGAWQDWRYEVEVSNFATGTNRTIAMATFRLRVTSLMSRNMYGFRVRAISNSGHGPWSQRFVGETLKAAAFSDPQLLLSDANTVYKTSLDGFSTEVTLNHPESLSPVKGILVYKGRYLWCLANGQVYEKSGNEPIKHLPHIVDAAVLAVDWLTDTLYWASSKHNMIMRATSNNGIETIHQGAAVIQDLVLDAVHGYMYWTTSHSLESARLDGHSHEIIHTVPYFLGKYILGVALRYNDDTGGGSIYWLLKNGDKLILYQMALLTDDTVTQRSAVRKVAKFTTTPLLSPVMHYYSGKLFWQGGRKDIIVLDIRGNSLAKLLVATSGDIETFTLVHSSLYWLPDGWTEDDSHVIPDPIDKDSVQIAGPWNQFNVTWTGVRAGHSRNVYYQVEIDHVDRHTSMDTNQPQLVVTDVAPYTEVRLRLKACTRWGCSQATERTFRSPMAAPTRPLKPAVFVRHDQSVRANMQPVTSDLIILVVLRWFPPTQPNGNINSYQVYKAHSAGGPWSKASVEGTKREYRIKNAIPGQMYYFKIGACTPVSCGEVAGPVHANTSVENPEPNLLAVFDDHVNLVFPYYHGRKVLETAKVTSLTYIMPNAHSLFWIDENNQLLQVDGLGKTKLLSLNGTGRSLSADWVGRVLYWLEETSDGGHAIMKYDLYRNSGRPELVMSVTGAPGMMAVAPLSSALYWTSSELDGTVKLLTAQMSGTDPQSVFKQPNQTKQSNRRHRRETCNCPPHLTITEVFALDHSRKGVLELYVVDKDTGSVIAMDTEGCQCKRVVNTHALQNTSLPPDSLVVDHQRVYWLNKTDHVIKSVDKFTGKNMVLETSGNISTLVAYSYVLQPEPEPACLILGTYPKQATLIENTKSSVTLRLSPWQPLPECRSASAPMVKYTMHYKMVAHEETWTGCGQERTPCLVQDTFDLAVTLSKLQPYSLYLVQVSVSNFYTDYWWTSSGPPATLGPGAVFQTLPGVPSSVRNLTAKANTPTEVIVSWRPPEHPNGPLTDIIYFVEWLTVNKDGSQSHDRVEVEGSWLGGINRGTQVKNLKSSQWYHLKVLAYDKRMTGYSSSPIVSTLTYQYPGPIRLLETSKTSVTVSWTSPSDDSVARHTIECTKVTEDSSWAPQNSSPQHTENDTTYNETFHDLQANTEYVFKVKVIYKSVQHFMWPLAMKFKFRTAADVPGQPASPVVSKHSGLNVVSWKEPDNGGATILMYKLISRNVNGDNWTTVYNGTDTRWLIVGLEHGEMYVFQVAALNEIGWGTFSGNSTTLTSYAVTEVDRSQDQLTIVLASTFAIILLFVIVAGVTLTIACRRYKQQKPVPFNLAHVLRQNPDLELATLRELPRITMQQSNALYAINIVPTDEDIAALPHFHRDQLTLTKFLGSGAFGEVFEGIARNIISSTSGETKVAVKTLRKGATDQEKEEFLKEAVLMSNFIEEHILRLLGVCLDNDPQFIILELMEGGDLLSHLRASRPTPMFDAKIGLPDMVNICVDVAQGCKYLEDMHFVHRDLAARNCLVSLRHGLRQVKIGDFGLARDIYKSDYYRKEGEGLLPVRWMSPESLVDGVFTTQSDVWAFGVMMWEVLTLGQQPYPARSNIEVLNFVRSGGRLDRPDNCPDDVYYLMLKCWQFVPEDRPSFKYILDQLQVFKDRCRLHDSDFATQPAAGGTVNIAMDDEAGSVEYMSVSHWDVAGHAVLDSASQSATGTASRAPPMGTMERIKSFIVGGMDTDCTERTNQPKMRLQDAMRRAITFDRKNVHGARQHSEDVHGYLEPLVPPLDEQHKYLELLDTLAVHSAPPGDKDNVVLPNSCVKLPADTEHKGEGLAVPKQSREVESPGSEGKSRKNRSPRLESSRHVSYSPLATSDIDSPADSDAEMSVDLCGDQKCDRQKDGDTTDVTVRADSLLHAPTDGQVLPPADTGAPQCSRVDSKFVNDALEVGEDSGVGSAPGGEGDLTGS